MEFEITDRIRKLAFQAFDPDDVFTMVENIVQSWWEDTSETYAFKDQVDIWVASEYLADKPYLVPIKVMRALGRTVANTIEEASEKKYSLKSLQLSSPKAGRKKEDYSYIHFSLVQEIARKKRNRNDVYKELAAELNKSPDTIRRIYERYVEKKIKKSSKPREYYYGKINK